MKLREFRESKRLSQRELAKVLDFKLTTYNGYERGVSEPSIDTLIKLADFYKVTVDELLGHEVPYLLKKIDFSAAQLEIVEEVKTLDNDMCNKVLSYIEGLKDGKKQH